jgi:hypothetical protein
MRRLWCVFFVASWLRRPSCAVLVAPSWPWLVRRPPSLVSSLVSSVVRRPVCVCLGALSWCGSVLLLSSLAAVRFLAVPLTIPVPVPVAVLPLVVVVVVLVVVWAVPIAVGGTGVALLSPPRVSLLSSVG